MMLRVHWCCTGAGLICLATGIVHWAMPFGFAKLCEMHVHFDVHSSQDFNGLQLAFHAVKASNQWS